MSHSSPIVQLPGVAGATCAPSAWKDYLDYLYDSTDTASPVSVCSYNSTGAQSLSSGYWGGSFSPTQGKIYLSPHVAGTTGVWCSLDLLGGTVGPYTHGTSGLVGGAPYLGSVWSPKQDQIFFTPCSQHSFYHYVDCRTGKVAGFDTTGARALWAYYGGAYDPHSDKIWLPPALGATGSSWPAIDCSQKKLEWYPSGATGIQFDKPAYHGAVYSPSQRRVYYVPRWQVYKDTWHYVDCQSSSIVSYKHGVTGAGFSGLQYAGGSYDPVNDRIYLVPCTHNGTSTWHYIDCKGGSVVGYQPGTSGLPVGGLFREGVYSPLSRRLYLSPSQEAGATGVWYYLDTGTNKLCSYAAPKASEGLSYYSGVFAPGVNRVYFSPGSQATQSTWHYIQETCGAHVPLDLGHSVAHLSSPQVSFLCIDEAEVSMLCVDGTDGKGGVYQLTTVFQDGVSRNAYCAWSSSDPSIATVSSSGLVTAVSNGGAALGKDVTITATYAGTSYSCLFTVYQTMPAESSRYTLKGGCGGDSYADQGGAVLAMFTCTKPVPSAQVSMRLSEQSWAIAAESGTCGADSTSFSFYRFSFNADSSVGGVFRGYEVGAAKNAVNFGPSKTLNTKGLHSFGYGSSGYFADGATYPRVATTSVWGALQNLIFMRTRSNTGKLATFSTAGAARSEAQLESPTLCDLFYSQQNYVRYANRSTNAGMRVNSTVIPNIGTLGSTYDLSANNVPAGWFSV